MLRERRTVAAATGDAATPFATALVDAALLPVRPDDDALMATCEPSMSASSSTNLYALRHNGERGVRGGRNITRVPFSRYPRLMVIATCARSVCPHNARTHFVLSDVDMKPSWQSKSVGMLGCIDYSKAFLGAHAPAHACTPTYAWPQLAAIPRWFVHTTCRRLHTQKSLA